MKSVDRLVDRLVEIRAQLMADISVNREFVQEGEYVIVMGTASMDITHHTWYGPWWTARPWKASPSGAC